MMKIYNTLGRKVEQVVPLEDSLIRVYSCGLTVYDYAHIGNLRKYIFDDLLKRTLKAAGFKVKQVMNITDVGHLVSDADSGDDKIEKGAKREHKSAWEIAKFYEEKFIEDLEKLNIELPDVVCRATEHIDDQINLIKILEKKGYTYKTGGGIYFDSSKLLDYGKLALLDKKNLREGARVKKNPEKKNLTDFALWKFTPSGTRRDMQWPSPWGIGFPGWHIECSAMSTKYLGQPFEIHTGGVDHIAVHHTNEIAQSEAAFGKPLAKYWVHSEHLLENGRKMAKSAGHFIRLQDLKDRGFDPLDFRYFCLTAHYRTKLDFSWESLEAAKNSLQKIRTYAKSLNDKEAKGETEYFKAQYEKFSNLLLDDLKTPQALAVLFETIAKANEENFKGRPAREFLEKIDRILAIKPFEERKIPERVKKLAEEREDFRKQKNFSKADEIRSEIIKQGFDVEDTADGTEIF
ncbi:MAG: cysteine--tRNA ligase [Candidatus Margulisiibacteriota bacterium]